MSFMFFRDVIYVLYHRYIIYDFCQTPEGGHDVGDHPPITPMRAAPRYRRQIQIDIERQIDIQRKIDRSTDGLQTDKQKIQLGKDIGQYYWFIISWVIVATVHISRVHDIFFNTLSHSGTSSVKGTSGRSTTTSLGKREFNFSLSFPRGLYRSLYHRHLILSLGTLLVTLSDYRLPSA